MYAIHRLKSAGRVPDVPVYLNSPMAANVTAIFHSHRGEHRLSPEECDGMCGVAHIVNTVEESKALNERSGPMIIISASGMATGGRVLHHLAAFAPDERNLILLTGFQAGGTRGAALERGATEIKIHGRYVPVRAEVVNLDMLSAHADYPEILDWLGKLRQPPAEVFVTHGEPSAADALRKRTEERFRWPCRAPEHNETVELVDVA
jgi:metallo-beta-lactamase family protein